MISQPNTGFVSCSFLSSMYFECYGKSGTRAIQEASPIAVIKEKKTKYYKCLYEFFIYTHNRVKMASSWQGLEQTGSDFSFSIFGINYIKEKKKICLHKKKKSDTKDHLSFCITHKN